MHEPIFSEIAPTLKSREDCFKVDPFDLVPNYMKESKQEELEKPKLTKAERRALRKEAKAKKKEKKNVR